MGTLLHTLGLGSLLAAVPLLSEDGATPHTGVLGQVAPQSADVRLLDAVPHQDDHGGTLQQLVCAAGSKAGFTLLWRDHREGMMGLYLGHYGHEGELLAPEGPIHQAYASRRLQPALCEDAQGAGIALWVADVLNLPVLYGHSFDAKGQWLGSDQTLSEVPQAPHDPSERTRGVQLPSAAPLEGGGFAVAWTMRGAVWCTEIGPDGMRRGEPRRLNPREQAAEAGVQLCGTGAKNPLAVWQAQGRLWSLPLRATRAAPRDLGPGKLVRSMSEDDGSAWLLLASEQGSLARRLREDGSPDGEAFAVCGAGEQALDFASLGSRLAVVVQTQGAKLSETPGRGRGGRTSPTSAGASFVLRIVDPAQSARAPSIDFLSAQARISGTPLVAFDGRRLLLAWTDTREGDPDIYARLVTPAAEPALGPDLRANTDRASADQLRYRIDAQASTGIVAWIDRRDSLPRAYARRIAAPGSFTGDEFPVPGLSEGASAAAVVPCFGPQGSCAYLCEEVGGALRVAVQDASGKLLGEARTLEAAGAHDGVLVPLPAGAGWLCSWIGASNAVWSVCLDTKGVPAGEKQRASRDSAAPISNLALCSLGGRRYVAAWDVHAGDWSLHGVFLGQDGSAQGREFELEASPRHQDWDPALASAPGGGFVVAWTSGTPDDRSRDVVARFFDAQARSSGPLLWISPSFNEQDNADIVPLADGTFAVGWEDDVSGYDHTYVRRIQKDRRSVGPIVRINQLETKSIPGRVAPRLAAFGDGLLFAFGDRARSLGWDVRVRIDGPGFDDVGKK
ncbi:MAG: hypothetical protein IPJ19_00660 [Planctomycetes bacterium]|nr:hypothetical protein [Planctomycetota bacterium]